MTTFGAPASLALDGDGYPHIGYYKWSDGDLKYAYLDGSGWHIQVVESDGDVGNECSLVLDRDGYPHISYYDTDDNELKYAYLDASGWHFQTVESDVILDLGTSLALDADGYGRISYFDSPRHDLKYASFVEVPEPVADFSASPTSGFAPLSVGFTNTSSGYFTASLWDFGDGQTSTQRNPVHIYVAPEVYTVSLTVSGSGGSATLTRTDYISIYPAEVPDYIVFLPLLLRGP